MKSGDKKKRNETKQGGSNSGKNMYILFYPIFRKALPLFIMVLKIVAFEIKFGYNLN